MRILAIEHDLSLTIRPDLHDILRAEAAAVWDLQKHGVIREIWFTAGHRRAVILLECADLLEARRQLDALPLARQGLSEFEVMELVTYDGYERLFGSTLVSAGKHEEPPEY